MERGDGPGRNPQRSDRQAGNGFRGAAGWDMHVVPVARDRPAASRGIGNRRPAADPRLRRLHKSSISAISPWKRCADPATSMNTPSGGSGVTSGEYITHQRPRRSSAASSSSGFASTTVRSGTRDCACVTVTPQERPQRIAALSTLASTRRWPSMRAVTSGLSRGGASLPCRRSRSLGHSGRKSEMTLRIACLQNP
jgi:hypothetical protein